MGLNPKQANELDPVAIGGRIRAERIRAALTQNELAERAGIDRTSVTRYELGQHAPGIRSARHLAYALGIEPYWLLTGNGERKIKAGP